MKKQYIIPELAVIKIQTQQMLATSVNDLNELDPGIGGIGEFNLIPTDDNVLPLEEGGDNIFL